MPKRTIVDNRVVDYLLQEQTTNNCYVVYTNGERDAIDLDEINNRLQLLYNSVFYVTVVSDVIRKGKYIKYKGGVDPNAISTNRLFASSKQKAGNGSSVVVKKNGVVQVNNNTDEFYGQVNFVGGDTLRVEFDAGLVDGAKTLFIAAIWETNSATINAQYVAAGAGFFEWVAQAGYLYTVAFTSI